MSTEETGSPSQAKDSLFIRLFRGEVSLPVTSWVYGVLGNIVFSLIYNAADKKYEQISMHDTSSLLATAIVLLLIGLLRLFYNSFIMIAIWRSADKYRGPIFWSLLARIIVVFNIMAFLITTSHKIERSHDRQGPLFPALFHASTVKAPYR